MTKIARYLFGNELAEQIATRKIDNQHWYAAIDICNYLGIVNHSQAVHRERETDAFTLHDSEWRLESIFNGRSKRQMLMVNDNGMLKLIMQASSEFAKEVQQQAQKAPPHILPATWQANLIY